MRKFTGPRPVADLVPACLGPLAAKRGFAGAELVSRWAEIAGPEIAARTAPVRVQFGDTLPIGALELLKAAVRPEVELCIQARKVWRRHPLLPRAS